MDSKLPKLLATFLVTMLALALVFGFIAIRPNAATRPLAMLLGLVPVASAVAIYSMMGNFFAGHILLLAGGAVLLGGALRQDKQPAA